MSLIIDGHNLIPKIPGLSLSDIDDERQLIEMLHEYCRIRRKKAEIYFDKAPAGFSRSRNMGVLMVKFAPVERTADAEIKNRLARLGKSAPNWIVVSSDRSVQNAARMAHAQVMASEAFSADLQAALRQTGQSAVGEKPALDRSLSAEEMDQWLRIFGQPPKKE